jgi:long-chain fatty acid transport protein
MERSMRAILCPSPDGERRRSRGATAIALSIGLGFFPAVASAAGFLQTDLSPAGTGLAGAMTARADDASAIFYNPAGLGFQSGLSVLAGITLQNPIQSVTDSSGNSYDAKRVHPILPTIYAAARVTDRLAFGLGLFVNHGLVVDWQNADDARPFPGRYKTLSINLQTFTINPTMTFRPIPELAIGAGIDIELGTLELIRALSFGSADGRIDIAGSSVAVGGNVGMLARLLDGRLNFGLNYRSGINLHFQNMQVGATAPPGVNLVFPFNQAATDVTAPNVIALGVAGKPANFLTISADFISALWDNVHDQTISLSDPAGDVQVSPTPRNWHNAYSGRLGVEADLGTAILARSKLWPKVRVGFGYDQSPVPTNTMDTASPDSDRFLVSAGVSIGYRGLGSIELGYMAVLFRERTSDNPDLPLTYDTTIHTFSMALNLQLEKVFGKRSPAYAARLLDRSQDEPVSEPNSSAD